jgi:glycosidase
VTPIANLPQFAWLSTRAPQRLTHLYKPYKAGRSRLGAEHAETQTLHQASTLFFENHDMPRLQSIGADEAMLRLAVVLIMVCRSRPCLYHGCEQALHDDTNGGNDRYKRPMMASWDTEAPLYQTVAKLAHVRKSNIAVQFGSQWTKYLTPDVHCFSRH